MNGVLRRKAGSFFLRSSLFEQLWFVPVWLMLGLSRGAVLVVAFRRLAPMLGVSVPPYPWVPLVDHRQRLRALRIGRVVRMAAGYTPWSSNCFAQAITARFLLVWYGIPYALFFGLAPAETAGKAGRSKMPAWTATTPPTRAGGSRKGPGIRAGNSRCGGAPPNSASATCVPALRCSREGTKAQQ